MMESANMMLRPAAQGYLWFLRRCTDVEMHGAHSAMAMPCQLCPTFDFDAICAMCSRCSLEATIRALIEILLAKGEASNEDN